MEIAVKILSIIAGVCLGNILYYGVIKKFVRRRRNKNTVMVNGRKVCTTNKSVTIEVDPATDKTYVNGVDVDEVQ